MKTIKNILSVLLLVAFVVTTFSPAYAGGKPGKRNHHLRKIRRHQVTSGHLSTKPVSGQMSKGPSSQTNFNIGDLKNTSSLSGSAGVRKNIFPTNQFPEESSYERDGRYQSRNDYDPSAEVPKEEGRYAASFPGQMRSNDFSANFKYRKEYGQQGFEYIFQQKELDRQKREAMRQKILRIDQSVWVDVKGFRDWEKMGITVTPKGDPFEKALVREFRRQMIERNGRSPYVQAAVRTENKPVPATADGPDTQDLTAYFHRQTRRADEYPTRVEEPAAPQEDAVAVAETPVEPQKPVVEEAPAQPAPSMVAMFHRDDLWEAPSWLSYETEYSVSRPQKKEVSSVYKPSRKALEAEAQDRGIPDEIYTTKTTEELQVLIDQFDRALNGRREGGKTGLLGPSAKDIAGEDAKLPPFIPDNFIPEGKAYKEPWNDAISQMRILVVDDPGSWMNLFTKEVQFNEHIQVTSAYGGNEAISLLQKDPQAYDVVLVNENIENGTGSELSMWMWKQQITCPVVSISNASAPAEEWHAYNTVGKISMDHSMQELINYASNIVATGKAYPNR